MVLRAQTLNATPAPWSDAAQAALERAEAFDTTRGLDSIRAMRERGAALFSINVNGAPAAWYVLEKLNHAGGGEVVIAAAAGAIPGRDLVAEITRLAQIQCAGLADFLTFHTKRRGLVKKASALGWAVDAVVMRKALKCYS